MYVALTFDDGTLHQYFLGRFLYSHNIKGTFFITTDLETHNNSLLMMNDPKKVHHLHRLGHEIGAHTCTHPDLSRLARNEIEREIVDSKLKLESIIEDEVKGFAYPDNYFNESIVKIVSRHFVYARCGTIQNNPWNSERCNKYLISSIGIKKLLTLPLNPQYIRRKEQIRLMIMIHDISILVLVNLIKLLQFGFKARFVTADEIADIIKQN
jgi:hypothetical protein